MPAPHSEPRDGSHASERKRARVGVLKRLWRANNAYGSLRAPACGAPCSKRYRWQDPEGEKQDHRIRSQAPGCNGQTTTPGRVSTDLPSVPRWRLRATSRRRVRRMAALPRLTRVFLTVLTDLISRSRLQRVRGGRRFTRAVSIALATSPIVANARPVETVTNDAPAASRGDATPP